MENELTNQKMDAILISSCKLGDDILQLKGKSFYLSYQREKNREALRALRKNENEAPLFMMGTFVNLDKGNATRIIEKSQQRVTKDIEATQGMLKEKFKLLLDTEKQSEKNYFDLKPLSSQELRKTCVHTDEIRTLCN